MFGEGFSEIVLIVSDVRAAAAFYRDVVGLTPETEPDDRWAWFIVGSPEGPPAGRQRLAVHKGTLLFEGQNPFGGEERWGRVHYAFRVPRERLGAAVAHVRERGVEVFGPVRHEWMRATAYYFYDLDGNLLEWWSPDPEGAAADPRGTGASGEPGAQGDLGPRGA